MSVSVSKPLPTQSAAEPQITLAISASRQFVPWLQAQSVSLAFTTYQANKLFFVGTEPSGKLSVFERTFERSMGLCVRHRQLWLSTSYQLWRFENSLLSGQSYQGYDAVYVPQMSYVTGDVDIHDVAYSASRGAPVFVNTLFSCLATVSESHSFAPVWQPPFITKLAAEDRCHLNGLAIKDDEPRYVTAISQSDVADGWRDRRTNGGCVMDIESDAIVVSGLSMPHSPRWYRDRLWLLNSGTGELGYVDMAAGQFVPIAFCPGYLRGLSFVGDFAVVGLSKPRHNRSFQGLPLDEALASKGAVARCGLGVIDLRSGDLVHTLRIEGGIDELYDVAVIEQCRRPMAVGLRSDEIKRVISVAASA